MCSLLLAATFLSSLREPQSGSTLHGPPTTTKLIGVWQQYNSMAAGWAEAYCFFLNGKVVWHGNTMDQDKRLEDRSGTWSLQGNRLTLRYSEETIILGGHLVPDYGGETDSNIKGGKETHRRLPKPVVVTLTIGSITSNSHYPSAKFGSKRFWKFDSDPKVYSQG